MSSDIEVRQLRVFLAVVEAKTIGRAARMLGLAQSTVSESLAALDRAIGTPTIQRTRGAQRVALTAAGKALLPHAQATLAAIEAARTAVASAARNALARLDVLANESVSTYLLPAALDRVRASWPGTKFVVSIETCATIRTQMAAGRADIGLMLKEDAGSVTRRPRSVSLTTSRDLRRDLELDVIASPRSSLARQRVRSLEALGDLPMFVADGAGDFYDMLSAYLTGGRDGAARPRLEPVGTIEAVRRAVLTNVSALGVLPHYAVADDLEAGRISRVAVRPAPPSMRLVALTPGRSPQHPAVEALIEALAT